MGITIKKENTLDKLFDKFAILPDKNKENNNKKVVKK